MIYTLYDIVVHLALILLSPYFLFRMIFNGKYREGLLVRFGLISKRCAALGGGRKVVWFHAVSVGETLAVMPLVRSLKEAHPDVQIAFSTVTPTGQKIAKAEGEGLIDALIFFPLDLSWIVNRVLSIINPSIFIIVEKEYWPNMIRFASERGMPILVVNGTMSESSYSNYKRLSFFCSDMFRTLSLFCARTKADAEKLITLGMDPGKVKVIGNIKFDKGEATSDSGATDKLRRELSISEGDLVIVAGSTHKGEEDIIARVYKVLLEEFPALKLILAPRHPERFDEVVKIIQGAGLECARRSLGESGQVVVLDTLGELSTAYALSTVSFVGGSLVDIGGHNLFEPAVHSRAVVFGPHISSCIEMGRLLVDASAGIKVNSEPELVKTLKWLLSDRERATDMGKKARGVLDENSGATGRTLRIVEEMAGLA